MEITLEFLRDRSACRSGIDYVTNNDFIGLSAIDFVKKLMKHKEYPWANWLIVQCMEYKQYVSYAVFAAEQVIDIYEKKYPDNDKPRKAIEVAKLCVENSTGKSKAADTANAAYAAYAAAHAAYAVAYVAVYAVYAAAHAAYAAYAAAYAAAHTAAHSAYAASHAAVAAVNEDACDAAHAATAKEKMQVKILNYGLTLIK